MERKFVMPRWFAVVKLPSLDKTSKTTLVTLEIPREQLPVVRSFRRR